MPSLSRVRATTDEDGKSESGSAPNKEGSKSRSSDASGSDEQHWTDRYGALILFFEQHGHSDVPPDHPLVNWVSKQRVRLKSLSEQQVKQLLILNFWFIGVPRSPYEHAERCVVKGCNKFAAFNIFCHGHYAASLTITPNDRKDGNKSAVDLTAEKANKSWAERYGALILFFEKEGHANIPGDHYDLPLKQWVAQQRANYKDLPEERKKQLTILNFWFPGVPHIPVKVGRCSRLNCFKFAAFNGSCHRHFSKTPIATLKTPQSKPQSTPQPKNLESDPKPKPQPKEHVYDPKPEFPLIGLVKRKQGNYDIGPKEKKLKDITRQEVINKLDVFIKELAKFNCGNISHCNRRTKCECMKFLNDKPVIVESVSHAIMDYYDLTHLQRSHYTVERFRYSEIAKKENHYYKKDGPQLVFTLPLSYEYFEQHCLPGAADDEGGETEGENSEGSACKKEILGQAFKHPICIHAFSHLHNIGESVRQRMNTYARGDISVGQHGNAGKKWGGRIKYAEAYESMGDLLSMLTDEYREFGQNKNDEVILPLEISKRKAYERWCRERGWDVKRIHATKHQEKTYEEWGVRPGFYRTEKEAIENGGDVRDVAKFVVSWPVFNTFWSNDFPHLKSQGRVGKGMFGGKYDQEKKKYDYS